MAAKSKKGLASAQVTTGSTAAGAAPNGHAAAPPKRERIAVIGGLRTPFAHRAGVYWGMSALDLARLVVRELLARVELDPAEVELVVYGQVIPSLEAPNIAREIVLGAGMPKDVQAFSVSRACATSFQAMTSAAEAMLAGQCTVAVAGGADSATDVPITLSRPLVRALLEARAAGTLAGKLGAFAKLSWRELVPVPPAAREPSTGLLMGESAEKMAKEASI